MTLSRIPKIYSNKQELQESRKTFETMLASLESFVKQAHIKDSHHIVGSHQPFFLAYQNTNNKRLLSRYGSICIELMKGMQSTISAPAPRIATQKIKNRHCERVSASTFSMGRNY